MAKMFYTLEEAAERLSKSADEVREMAKKGQIQEFRDRDKLMFKTDQIDLLAADEEHGSGDEADLSSMIPLADDSGMDLDSSASGESSLGESGAPAAGDSGVESELGESESTSDAGDDTDSLTGLLGESGEMGGSGLLGGSGSGLGGDPFADSAGASGSGSADAADAGEGDKKERTGVGIFDADEMEDVDPSEMTVMSGSGSGMDIDNLGSGSGLMDLTRESDDTSLGADFLEELSPGEEGGEEAAGAAPEGGLFEGEETTGVGAGAGAVAYAPAEPYDGAGSGFIGGLSLGAVVAASLASGVLILALLGAPDMGLMDMVASNFLPIIGGLAGVTVILGALGFVLGKRS